MFYLSYLHLLVHVFLRNFKDRLSLAATPFSFLHTFSFIIGTLFI